jgi:isocitrate dehydrogenase (NAD+)
VAHTVCLIPGDGIGPEVSRAAREIVDAAGARIEWLELPAGAQAAERWGDPLPPGTVEAIEAHRVALKGPLTTPVGRGFVSLNVRLRKLFNLYAAIRPVRSLPGVRSRYEAVDIVVIRENTEGLYSGLEH